MRTLVVLAVFLGIPLAEGTLSPSSEAEHWRQSGIDSNYVHRFVKNEHCSKSPLWREACTRGIHRGLRFIEDSAQYSILKAEFDSQVQQDKPNFAAWIGRLENEKTLFSKAMMWGYMVNAVLTTFDAHSRIQPFGINKTVGSGAHDEIGVGLQFEVGPEAVKVRRVFPKSPAAEAGIAVNDRLVAIDSRPVGEGLDAFASLRTLRGAAGRSTRVTFERGGAKIEKTLKLEKIHIPDVTGKTLKMLDRRVSVISIHAFNAGVCQAVQDLVRAAAIEKADGLILDLRFNPGGRNNEAVCIGKIFAGVDAHLSFYNYFTASLLPSELDLKPTVFVGSYPDEATIVPEVQFLSVPLVVLVNSTTASVSEMLAAGLQDLERAWIVGEPTLGKGTFQLNGPLHFERNLQFRHSICQVIRPIGGTIQGTGVTPNFIVPFESADLGKSRTFLKEKDLFPYAVAPASPVNWVEKRGHRHDALKKCIQDQGWGGQSARKLRKRDGFEDYQQAFALAALRCGT